MLKIFAVEPLVSDMQQFKNCPVFLSYGVDTVVYAMADVLCSIETAELIIQQSLLDGSLEIIHCESKNNNNRVFI